MAIRQLSIRVPPSMAVAENATTPNPAGSGALIWSTTAARSLMWNGTKWVALATQSLAETLSNKAIANVTNAAFAVGAAPAAWVTGAATFSLDLGNAAVWSNASTAGLYNNAFVGASGNLKKVNAIAASGYTQSAGAHFWTTAPGGNNANVGWNQVMSLSTAGVLTVASLTQTSDERVKTNWRPLAPDFVARLARVKHGVYERTDTPEPMEQVGVSAQSLRALLPQAVVQERHADGTEAMLAVNYGNAALAACVELAREVVALRRRIATLEGT